MFNTLKKFSILLLSASFIGVIPALKSDSSVGQNVILNQITSEELEEALSEAIQTKLASAYSLTEFFDLKTHWKIEYVTPDKAVRNGLRASGYAELDYDYDFEISNLRVSGNSIYFNVIFNGSLESDTTVYGYNYGKSLGRDKVNVSADVERVTRIETRICPNGKGNRWAVHSRSRKRKARDIYLDRNLSFEGRSPQEIEDFVEDTIKRRIVPPIQDDYQYFIDKKIQEAIASDENLKAKLKQLTNLPSCK